MRGVCCSGFAVVLQWCCSGVAVCLKRDAHAPDGYRFRIFTCVNESCYICERTDVCCSVLQFAAVCCSLLQCVAVCCSRATYVRERRLLQCVAVWNRYTIFTHGNKLCHVCEGRVLQCVAVCCSAVAVLLQCCCSAVAVCEAG